MHNGILWWWDNQEKEGSGIASFDAPQRTWWATLTGPAPPLTCKNCLISLCHFLLFAFPAFDNVLVLLFIFQGRGIPRRRRKPRSMWVRKWLSERKRERYGHYSTLLTELRTEDGKAFYKYTRLPRGLYDEVLRRVEGRIEKDTWYRKSLPPSLKLSITTTPGLRWQLSKPVLQLQSCSKHHLPHH